MNDLEKLVYQFIVENSYIEENDWASMRDLSKTLKVFPNTLRPIIQDLATRGMIVYNTTDDGNEYFVADVPDAGWLKEDLESLIDLY